MRGNNSPSPRKDESKKGSVGVGKRRGGGSDEDDEDEDEDEEEEDEEEKGKNQNDNEEEDDEDDDEDNNDAPIDAHPSIPSETASIFWNKLRQLLSGGPSSLLGGIYAPGGAMDFSIAPGNDPSSTPHVFVLLQYSLVAFDSPSRATYNTPTQPTLSIHAFSPSSQPILSTHPLNPLLPHTLSIPTPYCPGSFPVPSQLCPELYPPQMFPPSKFKLSRQLGYQNLSAKHRQKLLLKQANNDNDKGKGKGKGKKRKRTLRIWDEVESLLFNGVDYASHRGTTHPLSMHSHTPY